MGNIEYFRDIYYISLPHEVRATISSIEIFLISLFTNDISILRSKLLVDFPEIVSSTQIPYTTPLDGTNLFLKTEVDTKNKRLYITKIIQKYSLKCTVDLI